MANKRLFLSVFLFWLMGGQPVVAQFYPTQYRPPRQQWQQLKTPHFRILFPMSADSDAYRAAHILETVYPRIQPITGGSLRNFPVILNNYNDRSNGFVTSLHFRSEVDLSPIKGKALNPINGGWLQNVLPHELTHAVEFNHIGGFGVGRIINFFSPDLARSFHGSPPSGIQEGLAVYAESNIVAPGGGRGNYPYFNHQFDAAYYSSSRWSLGQMLQAPAFSRPLNRNYIGGDAFTQWLQDTYGLETSRNAIDFNVRWPFLGYGVALKHVTGQWPGALYHKFKDYYRQISPSKKQMYQPLPIKKSGTEIRRPKWLSDSTLIFYGSFYNAQSGFYKYDINHHRMHRIISAQSVSDYHYALSTRRDSIIYSKYDANLIYPGVYKTQLISAALSNGHQQRVRMGKRVYAPALSADSTLLALQHYQTYGAIVALNKRNPAVIDTLFSNSDYQLKAVVPAPSRPDTLAIVANKEGTQALWIASRAHLTRDLQTEPTISFANGSIFDPAWSPDGRRLLFSADPTGTLQIYSYTLQTDSLIQLTNAAYNAFEPSYSPDGRSVAFIIQRQNKQLPVVLAHDKFYNAQVKESSYHPNNLNHRLHPGLAAAATFDSSWTQTSYKSSARWLKPRTFVPTFHKISGSNRYQFGAGFYSSDLLQQQSYAVEATTTAHRLWYDVTYQNKQFFPGLKARIFSRPAFRRYQFKKPDGFSRGETFLREERSFALSVPLLFTLTQDVRSTSMYIAPEFRLSQLRFFDSDGHHPSNFSNAAIGKMYAQFNYRLQQNIRDVQPNSGLILYSEIKHFFSSGSLTLHAQGADIPLNFSDPTAARGGLYGFMSPLRRWNQSLRLGLQALTQNQPIFDTQSIVSDGFSGDLFPFAHNLLSLNARYTIPLFYPDNGGFLIPLYVSDVYLSGFANTVSDPARGYSWSSSRTVVGGALHIGFRLSNLSFNIGIGLGFEPSRRNVHYFLNGF